LKKPNEKLSPHGVQKIDDAIAALKSEELENNSANWKLRELAKAEADKSGIAELARRLAVGRPSLSYFINDKREIGGRLAAALRGYFRRQAIAQLPP
jgi:hypothetical protein